MSQRSGCVQANNVQMPRVIDIKSPHSWHQKLLQGHVGSFTEGVKSLLLIVVFDP